MLSNKKRKGRQMQAANITTLIAADTVIDGHLHFSGGLHLDGRVSGSVIGQGEHAVFTLSESGSVDGEINSANAIINGRVNGDISVSERLELAGDARVHGNVYYKVLEMAAGAQVNGKMVYQSDVPRQLSGPVAVADAEPEEQPAKAAKA